MKGEGGGGPAEDEGHVEAEWDNPAGAARAALTRDLPAAYSSTEESESEEHEGRLRLKNLLMMKT